MNTKSIAASLDSLLAAATHYNEARAAYEACMSSKVPTSVAEAACQVLLDAKEPFADGTDTPRALDCLSSLIDELEISTTDPATLAQAALATAKLTLAAYTISSADNAFLTFTLMQGGEDVEG